MSKKYKDVGELSQKAADLYKALSDNDYTHAEVLTITAFLRFFAESIAINEWHKETK